MNEIILNKWGQSKSKSNCLFPCSQIPFGKVRSEAAIMPVAKLRKLAKVLFKSNYRMAKNNAIKK
jgi:hypothetical protein